MNWKRMAGTLACVSVIGMTGVLGVVTTRAQPATPDGACPVTTPEENAALARTYWEAVYNGRDPEQVPAFLAEDFTRHNLARTHQNEPGNADDIQRAAENLEDYQDLEISVDEVIAAGDSVAVRMTWTGTHSDPIAPWEAPVSDESMSMTVMAFYKVDCGKLSEQWIVFDYLSAFRQLGIITDDELETLGSAAAESPGTPAAGQPVD